MMAQVGPLFISAVDAVIEDKDQRAEWQDDEMRGALIDVQKGKTMEEAAEGRDLSAGAISRANTHVRDKLEELEAASSSGESLFNDPVGDAIEGFEEFFSRMEDKYGIEVNNIAIQLMVDEIQDNGQLPTARSFQGFLSSINSGINDDKIWLLTRRYESWLNNYSSQDGAGGYASMDIGMGGGQDVTGGGGRPPGMAGGVALGGPSGVVPNQQQPHTQQSDPRIDALEEQISEIKELVTESTSAQEAVGTVTVERDDGTSVTLPANHPQAIQLLNQGGDNDSPDMMEMLAQAKEAGLIVTPSDIQAMQQGNDDIEETVAKLESLGLINDDKDEALARAIQTSVSELGAQQLEAQQRMSDNFRTVVEEMRDLQEDTQEELTLADVEDVIESKLTKSETERLREEMDSKFSEVMESVEKANRRSATGHDDPEFLKTDREMEFRERQLETLNDNLTTIPKEVAESVRDGLLPALKEVKMLQEVSDQPLFTPPVPVQRQQPTYTPQQAPQQTARRSPQQGKPEPQGGPEGQTSTDDGTDQYTPDTSDAPPMGQETPQGISEEDAKDVRRRLGLEDDAEAVGAEQ